MNSSTMTRLVASLAVLLAVPALTGASSVGASSRADMTTRAAQYILRATHHYQGPLDGAPSPATQAAIQEFQDVNGLPTTGRLDERTLALLRLTRSPQTVGLGKGLRAAMTAGFEHSMLVPDWSSLSDLQAFRFAVRDNAMRWSYVHVCGHARFPTSSYGERVVPFMMDLILDDAPQNPPVAALWHGQYLFSDLWTAEYGFVEPFCDLRVGSAVALGAVR